MTLARRRYWLAESCGPILWQVRDSCGESHAFPRIPTTSDMRDAIHHSNHPQRVITPSAHPHPAHCDHEHEAVAHMLSDALQRCAKRGSQEVK